MRLFHTASRVAAVLALLLLPASFALAEDLKVVGWNLESGDSSPPFLATQIEGVKGVDLWGFSEVQPSDTATFVKACNKGGSGQSFKSVLGTTGGADRLLIVYNDSRLELLEQQELDDLKFGGGRAPLFGKFRVRSTGEEFLFMVNHLHRRDADKRMKQTDGLRAWVEKQSVPSILTGDFNYDVDTEGPNKGNGNPAFQKMMQGGLVRWVSPEPFVPTHKSNFRSILDFVFLGGSAKSWTATSQVLVLSDFSTENNKSSDHRPVVALLKTATGPGPSFAPPKGAARPADTPAAEASQLARQRLRDEILKKINKMELELIDLRRMVRELAED